MDRPIRRCGDTVSAGRPALGVAVAGQGERLLLQPPLGVDGVQVARARRRRQTETALHISASPQGPLQAGLRDLVARRGLDISDAARVLAAVDLSVGDAIGVCWAASTSTASGAP